jgi:hypothetical protein
MRPRISGVANQKSLESIMKFSTLAPSLALTLVFSNSASAQTVPAELWVGPPLATSASHYSRADVVAAMERAATVAQAPQQSWVGSAESAGAMAGALTRSQVEADFNLFARAGLSNYDTDQGSRAHFEPFGAEGARRAALYARLRGGPEYAAEVSRLDGMPRVADASAADASAE